MEKHCARQHLGDRGLCASVGPAGGDGVGRREGCASGHAQCEDHAPLGLSDGQGVQGLDRLAHGLLAFFENLHVLTNMFSLTRPLLPKKRILEDLHVLTHGPPKKQKSKSLKNFMISAAASWTIWGLKG